MLDNVQVDEGIGSVGVLHQVGKAAGPSGALSKSQSVSPSASSHIVMSRSAIHCNAAAEHDVNGDVAMARDRSSNTPASLDIPLKTLPGPLLGRLWPASRTVLGIETCRFLREELLAHAEGVALQRRSPKFGGVDSGVDGVVSPQQVCADLTRFPHSKIYLQQGRGSPFIPQLLANSLLEGLTAALPSLSDTLVHLNLARTRLGDDGARTLARGLEMCRGLVHVDLEANGIGDAGACALAHGLHDCRALAHLSVRDNKVGDAGAHSLAQTLQLCSQMRMLDLGQNEFGDDGTASLAMAIARMQAVETLNLSWNCIGQDGASHLARVLGACTSLGYLYLGRNKLGDAGVGAIAGALPDCPALVHVDLGRNEVGDWGALKLAAVLLDAPSLAFLDLGRNRIGDEGEEELSRMRRQREQGLQINFGGQRSLTNYT